MATPTKFPQVTNTYAENQPEYLPLPVHRNAAGEVTSCWQLTPEEMVEVLRTGCVFVTLHTFNQNLQPITVAASFRPWDPVKSDEDTARDATVKEIVLDGLRGIMKNEPSSSWLGRMEEKMRERGMHLVKLEHSPLGVVHTVTYTHAGKEHEVAI